MKGGAKLTFASNAEFYARPDGLKPLEEKYGFEFPRENVKRMDTGLVYQALKDKQVDVGLVFATDGRVPAFNFVVLKDDKGFFPNYALTPVVRKEVLDANPKLAEYLNALSAKLDDATMARLNASVDVDKKTVEDVARDFLKEQGLGLGEKGGEPPAAHAGFVDAPLMTRSHRSLAVAAAQVASVPGDLARNLRKHLDMIDAARAMGIDVLVFPELSLTGHSGGTETLRLALRRDDPMVVEIGRASGSMCTVVGLIQEAPAAQFYNAAIALREGAVVAVHRKLNLATYGRLEDGKHFAAGSAVDTFAIDDWRASIMICADLWNPPLVHLAALQGITVLLAPISSALEAVGGEFDNPGGWDVNLRFHALTYGLPFVMANRVGHEDGLTFWGGSRILDPFGRALAKAEGSDETLVHARIDYDDVRRARYLLPTIRDANVALLRRELDRITATPLSET